jgi:hypothetical protein
MQQILTEWRKYLAEQEMSTEPPRRTMVPKRALEPPIDPRVPPAQLKKMKAKAALQRRCADWKGYREECGGWSASSKGYADSPLISPEDLVSPTGVVKAAGTVVVKKAGAGSLGAFFTWLSAQQLKKALSPSAYRAVKPAIKKVANIKNVARSAGRDVTEREAKQIARIEQELNTVAKKGINPAKMARYSVAKASAGKLSGLAKAVTERVANGRVYRIEFPDAGWREFVVLEFQEYGPIAFYRSAGKSTPKLKLPGEWHIFSGFAAGPEANYSLFLKTPKSVKLTNGGNEFLTKMSLALEQAWNQNLLGKLSTLDLSAAAKANLLTINKKIEKLNKAAGFEKYMYYDGEHLASAYANRALRKVGSLEGQYGRSAIIPSVKNEYVGLNNIRSERLTEFGLFNKILPSLETVLGL